MRGLVWAGRSKLRKGARSRRDSSRVMAPTRESGQEVFQISRVGLGSGRAGSGEQVFNLSRIGSGHECCTSRIPVVPEQLGLLLINVVVAVVVSAVSWPTININRTPPTCYSSIWLGTRYSKYSSLLRGATRGVDLRSLYLTGTFMAQRMV